MMMRKAEAGLQEIPSMEFHHGTTLLDDISNRTVVIANHAENLGGFYD